jgi:hypothetical protein
MNKKDFVKAVHNLNDSDSFFVFPKINEKEAIAEFKVWNEAGPKQVLGITELSGNGLLLKINYHNYTTGYLKKKLKGELVSFGVNEFIIHNAWENPQPGDRVTIKIGATENPPSTKALPTGTYYFAVNSDFISCDGLAFRRNMHGQLEGTIKSACGTGSPMYRYAHYRLI